MRQKIIFLLWVSLSVIISYSCSSSDSNNNTTVTSVPEPIMELTSQKCEEIAQGLPDRGIDSTWISFYTDEYYRIWKEAWDIFLVRTSEGPCDDWMISFICSGSEGCDFHLFKTKSIDVVGDNASVLLIVMHNLASCYYDEVTMTILFERKNNQWLISDVNDSKQIMKEYIVSSRANFSDESYLQNLKENGYTKELSAIQDYFTKYPIK